MLYPIIKANGVSMNIKSLAISAVMFALMHIIVWFSNNAQLVPKYKEHALVISLMLSIPCSLVSFVAVKYGFEALGSAWGIRLLGFGVSYLVFPAMAWFMLGESPFSPKVAISVILSMVIVAVQLWWPE
jgi:NO-binding membrane sensor protein with MHYT domain